MDFLKRAILRGPYFNWVIVIGDKNLRNVITCIKSQPKTGNRFTLNLFPLEIRYSGLDAVLLLSADWLSFLGYYTDIQLFHSL